MISTDLKFLSLKNRCKGGSLPLKKRRFSAISELDPSSEAASALASLSSVAVGSYGHQSSQLAVPSSPIGLTALSLVAAAAKTNTEDAPLAVEVESKKTGFLQEAADEESSVSAKRFHSAPLEQPLPGGCHGRTSRNNSFCRRQPCYKGSRYCKLHYQQHVLSANETQCLPASSSVAAVKDESSTNKNKKKKSSNKSVSTTANAGNKTNNSSSTHVASQKKTLIQDKRFSGAEGEVRCQATTTRGRECAYIAVSCNKYCHLHADYDNNPPPRRGGGSTTLQPLSSKHKTPTSPELHAVSSFSSSDSATSAVASASKPAATTKAPADRSKRRSSSSKLAKKHMDSSVPLLSMISTDQWADKRVKVSVGPLADRAGTVEKWSNGWVSVRIEGVGLHNRRSFELHLLDDDQDLPQELKKLMTSTKTNSNNDNKNSTDSDSSRVTPSPNVSEDPSSVKSVRPTVRLSVGAPVTPSPSAVTVASTNTEEWPKTPAATNLNDKVLPFVPSVTPSPRTKPMQTAKAAVTTADSKASERLSEGLLLNDTAEPKLSLDLRVEALQRRLGGVPPPLSARPVASSAAPHEST